MICCPCRYSTDSALPFLSTWLDSDNHNVMSEFDFIQESTRCSKELADFLKEAFGDAPYNGPILMKQLKSSQEEGLQMSVNTNIFKQLPSPFTLNDLRKLKGSEFSDSALYSIVSRWKKEGWIEKADKSSWTKLLNQ